MLETFGWCYPDLRKDMEEWNIDGLAYLDNGQVHLKFKNARIFRLLFSEKAIEDFDEREKQIWDAVWEKLYGYLEKHNVILSEEGLWWRSAEPFFRQVKKQYSNTKIVVYLRRQDLYLESYWNQRVKQLSYFSETFKSMMDRNALDCQYLKRLDMLADIFGLENIIVRVYEKGQFSGERGDLISDFMETINIRPEWDECVLTVAENGGLSGNYLEIKRIMNMVLQDGDKASDQINDAFSQFLVERNYVKVNHIQGYFSKEDRKQFLERFSEENATIARKYLLREDGVLFRNMNPDIEEHKVDTDSMYEDIIKTFTALLRQMQETNIAEIQKWKDSFK